MQGNMDLNGAANTAALVLDFLNTQEEINLVFPQALWTAWLGIPGSSEPSARLQASQTHRAAEQFDCAFHSPAAWDRAKLDSQFLSLGM